MDLKKIKEIAETTNWLVSLSILLSAIILGGVSFFMITKIKYAVYALSSSKEVRDLTENDITVENRLNVALDVAYFLCNYTYANFASRHEFVLGQYVSPENRQDFKNKVLTMLKDIENTKKSCYFVPKDFKITEDSVILKGDMYLYDNKTTTRKEESVEVIFNNRDKYGFMIKDYIIGGRK